MKAKQRFYWLGVLESNRQTTLCIYDGRHPLNTNWLQWARNAYQAGFYGWSLRYC